MKYDGLLAQLWAQLKKLEQEVLQHDAALPPHSKKLLQDTERFNDALFVQHGAALYPCIGQLEKDIRALEQRLKLNLNAGTIIAACGRINDRFSAVKRALATTSIDVKAQVQARESSRKRMAARQSASHDNSGFAWIAASVMQNSHQLYDELNKHLNWARKIESKLEELESALENCHAADKIKAQNEILMTHRRLGKCRQAISYIEDRIQAFERPYQGHNR